MFDNGLGLSTVCDIVRQSGGTVWLDSSPGAGTTVRIYLPQVDERPADESLVRDLVVRTMRQAGYRVLVAVDGQEGLELSRSHSGPIDLLLTDVIMPRMGGGQMAEILVHERPGIRVLFVSGYTHDAIDLRRGLEPGIEFLQKPFTPWLLLERVRELLVTERAG